MEQDELGVVLDPSEVFLEQGGEAPAAAVLAGEVAGAEEGVSEVEGSVRVAVQEDAEKQDLQELSSELGGEIAAKLGDSQSEVRGAHYEFRAAAAGVPVLGASPPSAPAPVTGTQEDAPAMADGDHGATPGDDKKLNERACFAPGATVAIAHASPPDSYRRAPSRSRKQHSPKRFVPAPGSAASDGPESCCSSSSTPGRRGRKLSRPEHFNPGEAKATVRAKARRTGIALDKFITSVLRGYSASDSESAKNVTAGNTASTVEAFGIRDASHHAARARGLRAAISRPGASCGSPLSSAPAAAPGSPPGETDDNLGASLAPDVVAVPSLEKQDKRPELFKVQQNGSSEAHKALGSLFWT